MRTTIVDINDRPDKKPKITPEMRSKKINPDKWKLRPEQVQEALIKSGGMISLAAISLGVTRDLLYKHLDTFPWLKEWYDTFKDSRIDVAETTLMDFVDGNIEGLTPKERLNAVRFYLSSVARNRGYDR